VRLEGNRRLARRHLAALGAATRSPANLARAGVWLDPVVLARGIVARTEPSWAGEQRLTVAVVLSGAVAATFAVVADGGLAVSPAAADGGADATLALPTLAFYRWLSGEALDARVALHGDGAAVALVAACAERALGR
jgi:hypothetical protein